MNLIEKVFAAAMLVVCLVLLVRLFAGARRRGRFDMAWRRWRSRLQRRFGVAPVRESARQQAERGAWEAIERARGRARGGEWDGNVYRRKAFKRKKRDLH